MRRKRDFFGELWQRLDIPREALPGGFGAILSGQGELIVRGCRRILAYSEQQIKLLLCGRRVLCVEGAGLLCAAFQAGGVTITGEITALRFEEAGK